MKQYQTCKRCLYSTRHPLGLTIDDEGICSGCRIHEEKDSLDWSERWKKLELITHEYRSKDPKTYDCIIPVSGAQDSYFIVHTVKNLLKMNPLLVTYNKYWNTPLGIRNLANLRIKFNCDILIQNVNPLAVKRIVKTTLRQLGSIYWHCIAGQTVFPVQTAVRYKVPLIIWGAHQGMEQVGMFSHEHEVEMTRRYRKDHDLMGMEADDLLSYFDSLTEGEIWQYRYPEDTDLNAVGVRGIYLNNYVRWDPKAQHELMIKLYDYKTSGFDRTFDCYDFVDCYNYMHLHDLIKMYKHDFTKVTDHACREIRHKRITRDQALSLVSYYQSQPSKYLELFCSWLGIEEKSLKFLLDLHGNRNSYDKADKQTWNDRIGEETPEKNRHHMISRSPIEFEKNAGLNLDQKTEYITIGKGWP